jgi:hypothetical protein
MRPAWGALLALTACGPPPVLYVWVGAPLLVPQQSDALHLRAVRPSDGHVALDITFALDNGPQFPLTELADATDPGDLDVPLDVTVSALEDGGLAFPDATQVQEVTLSKGHLTRLTFQLAYDAGAAP